MNRLRCPRNLEEEQQGFVKHEKAGLKQDSCEPYQAYQLVVQDYASSSKADADQHGNGHPPIPPAYAKEAQVLPMRHCQVFFLNLICFCLLSMSVRLVSAM